MNLTVFSILVAVLGGISGALWARSRRVARIMIGLCLVASVIVAGTIWAPGMGTAQSGMAARAAAAVFGTSWIVFLAAMAFGWVVTEVVRPSESEEG